VHRTVGNYRCRFRVGKSTIDQITVNEADSEKTLEYRVNIFHLFVDLKAPYDTINREELLEGVKRVLNSREVTWNGKCNFGTNKCRVITQKNLSEIFGTLMGGALPCILLNTALEKVFRDSYRETKGTLCNNTIQIYIYIDNIVSVGRSKCVLKEAIMNFRKAAKKMGLKSICTKLKIWK
jgi:hypothetical protein